MSRIALICLLFPVLIVFGVVYNQMTVALLVDDLSIRDAIRKGWDVVRKNPGIYFAISLILLAIGIGFAIVISIPYFGILFAYLGNMYASDMLVPETFARQMPCFFTLASIMIALLGLLVSIFSMAVYVLTYLELSDRLEAEYAEPLAVEEIGLESV